MSVVMRTPRHYAGDNGGTFKTMKNCNCCPYGYHIDLDFIRYCEEFAKVKPSNDQLIRRDRRRSRKSLEFMLGLEHLFEHWEPTDNVQTVPEVSVEIEPESPRVDRITQQFNHEKESSSSSTHFPYTAADRSHESSKSTTPWMHHHHHESKSSSNSPPETSAFVHDALDDVVSDFERTFERTKTKDKEKRNCYSWEQYIDVIDSCVSGNKRQNDDKFDGVSASPIPPPPPPRRHDRELVDGNSEAVALHKIRQQMALSLRRMKGLEEQVKNIPSLQSQIISLNEEKLKLQRLLQQKEDELTKAKHLAQVVNSSPPPAASLPKHVSLRNKSTSPISFTPQRISPVSLESLGSRIHTNLQTTEQPKSQSPVIKRNVGTMCHQHTRDMSVGTNVQMTRSIGISPANTYSIRDPLYTQKELDSAVKVSFNKLKEEQKIARKLNLVSVGTQMIQINQIDKKDNGTQTPSKIEAKKISIGIMAVQKSYDAMTSCKLEPIQKICVQCSIPKRTIGCGPDTIEESKKYISLKQMEMPPRSVSFTLDRNEKLNVKRKTIGTQIQIETSTFGVQHTPIYHNQYSQCHVNSVSNQTDTRDLIKLCNSQTNTDVIPVPQKITHDFTSNTDTVQTIDHGVNTIPAATVRHSSSNTDHVYKKDASCGDINQPPHISIACSDNYCDSCKDAIKNLAKDFSKMTPPSPQLGRDSRIPRPKTSPRPIQKKFVRQNTYTVDSSSSSSSSPEKKFPERGRLDENSISCSLDSIRDPSKNVQFSMSQSYNTDELIQPLKVATLDSPSKPPTMVNLQGILAKEEIRLETSWVKEPSPKPSDEPLPSPPLATEEVQPTHKLSSSKKYSEAHQINKEIQQESSNRSNHQQAMLLNKIATSVSMPREKSSPSKEMKAALKVINDSLQKFTSKSSSLKSANSIVQIEWFRISSTDTANPNDVEDYLDCFEEFSNVLLKYVVNLIDSNGNTAMHYAVSHGNFDVVSILLDSKVCNVNQMNNAGYTCVMLVSLAKLKNSAHRTVVQRLFQMADVNIRAKKHCQTALMLAVSHGNLDMVEMLLGAGADINIQDEDGSTALMCAAEHGRIDIVKHLLSQSDCDSLIQDVDNSTAFKIAWQAGHRDIGLLLYVHEQMLRSKLPGGSSKTTPEHLRSASTSPRQQRHESP